MRTPQTRKESLATFTEFSYKSERKLFELYDV